MPCSAPLAGSRDPITEKIRFQGRAKGMVPGIDYEMLINCRQCVECLMARTRSWAVRCMHEIQMTGPGSFLTLTYDNEHLPVVRDDQGEVLQRLIRDREGNPELVPLGTLRKEDFVGFKKRAHQHYGGFRFFACGEYGGQATRRPHYHCIVFQREFERERRIPNTQGREELWTNSTLERLWGKGAVNFGSAEYDSAAYVAAYTTSKASGRDEHGEREENQYELSGRVEPYNAMSRFPGIGQSWIAKYLYEVYPRDSLHDHNGREMRPPEFYDKCLQKWDPTLYEEVIARRGEFMEEQAPDDPMSPYNPERIQAKRARRNASAKLKAANAKRNSV